MICRIQDESLYFRQTLLERFGSAELGCEHKKVTDTLEWRIKGAILTEKVKPALRDTEALCDVFDLLSDLERFWELVIDNQPPNFSFRSEQRTVTCNKSLF